MSDYFGEDKENPNWSRYKAHFTLLGATRAKCHGPILRYISITIVVILTLSQT
jgi:hypothetical protein